MSDVSSSAIVLVPRDSATTSSATTTISVPASAGQRIQTGIRNKKIEAAVYSHIRAIRALGRTTVNTAEIASALGVPRVLVEQAIASLSKKGVKLAP
jgi:hypothetical protein